MTEVFNVSTFRHELWGGPRRYYRFYIYDTVEELRAACVKFNRKHYPRGPYQNFSDTAGVCHPVSYRERYDRKKREWVQTNVPGWAGIIRLCNGWLTNEVVSHECVHAAIGIYRLDISNGKSILVENGNTAEEALAYMTGDIYAGAAHELISRGFWEGTL
jgi:hypothetical protein